MTFTIYFLFLVQWQPWISAILQPTTDTYKLLTATYFSLSEVLMNVFCILSHSQSYNIFHVILWLGLEGCVHYHRRA